MNITINIDGAKIEVVQDLIAEISKNTAKETILNREIKRDFDLQSVISEVVTHYFNRSIEEHGGNMTKVTWALGFNNYQTCLNWSKKYGVK